MADIRLPMLPDRTPVKLTIMLPPDLNARLQEYAAVYASTYGSEESIGDLIPAMLKAFLESDRAFSRRKKD